MKELIVDIQENKEELKAVAFEILYSVIFITFMMLILFIPFIV